MCGICGIFTYKDEPPDANIVLKMRDVMESRGPDGAGIHIEPHIGLGHRRLSIIDLSDKGLQPMSNEDGNIWIVFNGEIYNFQTIRKELIEKEHTFKSQTDSEVLIHGYEEWGIETLLQRLNGMFAFGLWDSKEKELILARDRLGVKPLFYMEKGGTVYFASDIKAIWLANDRELTVNEQAIDSYLYFYCIPQEYAIFKEVQKVPPGSYIRFGKGKREESRYWRLSFRHKENKNEEEIIEETADLLFEATKRRMISDVPLGVFLSGGVDSSTVTALMAQITHHPIKTFTVIFNGYPLFNEAKYAKAVSQKFSTEHYELSIQPDALKILPKLVWAYGEPFGDSSAVPTYYVARAAKDFITVALTGDGGDELFGGYPTPKAVYAASFYKRLLPQFVRSLAPSCVDSLTSVFGQNNPLQKLKTVTEFGKIDLKHCFEFSGSGVWGLYREKLYSGAFKEKLKKSNPTQIFDYYLALADGENDVDKTMFVEISTRLPNDYLVKVDVATMANSLEARSPFLDYELAQYAAQIPHKIKLKFFHQKYLLKKLSVHLGVPREVVYRKKMGFGIPVGFWFKGQLAPLVKSILLSEKFRSRGYFNLEYVNTVIEEHLSGVKEHTHRLWSLLWLELWHLIFVDRVMDKDSELYDMI